jgi:hypothetical protein
MRQIEKPAIRASTMFTKAILSVGLTFAVMRMRLRMVSIQTATISMLQLTAHFTKRINKMSHQQTAAKLLSLGFKEKTYDGQEGVFISLTQSYGNTPFFNPKNDIDYEPLLGKLVTMELTPEQLEKDRLH